MSCVVHNQKPALSPSFSAPSDWSLIETVYQTLASETDLSPNNPLVNQLLGQLVSFLIRQGGHAQKNAVPIETGKLIHQLPLLCSKAECEMEKWWAKRWLANRTNLTEALDEFWYTPQYQNLIHAEAAIVPPDQTAFYFLGSGALPLTCILGAINTPKSVQYYCIDQDAEACELSSKLIAQWGLANRISVLQADANQFALPQSGIAVCASLLRATDIYPRLFRQKIKQILVRDAEFPYTFLYYPAIKPSPTHYRELTRTLPSNQRINISRLFQRVE